MGNYRDYQELFVNCVIYYDLSLRGITGSNVHNLINDGTNNGSLAGANWAYSEVNRFQNQSILNNNWAANQNLVCSLLFDLSVANGSVVFWLKRAGNSTQFGVFGYYKDTVPQQGIFLDIRPSTLLMTFQMYLNGVYYGVDGGFLPTLYDWSLVSVTWGAGGSHIYVIQPDGVLNHAFAAPVGYPGVGPTTYLPIGGIYDTRAGSSTAFNGLISEVMIWKNRQLSENDLVMLWKLTRQKYLYPILPGIRGVQ